MALSKITNSGIGAIDTLAVDTDTLVVDSTNNKVGIGTTSPDELLELSDTTGATVRLHSTKNDGSWSGGEDYGSIEFYADDVSGAGAGVKASIRGINTTLGGGRGTLVFGTSDDFTNDIERMRIDSSGRLLIRKTSATTAGSCIEMERDMSTGVAMEINNTAASGSHNAIHFRYGGSVVGKISVSASSTSYVTSSDYRLKENVVADWDATTRLKQLNPVRFNFIADADTTVDGFLAHEVQSVVPEAITGTHNEVETWTQDEIDAGDAPANTSAGDNKLDDDGNTIPVYQGIDQSKLVPLLVKTIQELEARIAALETA